MPKKYPPLTPKDVIDILKANNIIFNNQEGSHAQYIGIVNGEKRKVTVDMAEREFGDELMKSMIRQSGLSRDDFYCSTKHTARKINRKIRENLG